MKKFLNKKIAVFAGAVLIALTIFSFKGDNRNFQISKNLDVFNTIFKELDLFYVDTLNPEKVIGTGIDAMLRQLDPYTEYYPQEKMKDLELMTKGTYGGIGAVIKKHKDYVAIIEPYWGMPAQEVGLKAGDLILEIDGKDMKGKTNEEVSNALRGQVGTDFILKVERPGEKKPLEFTITRRSIQLEAVPYYGIVGENTGYIILSQFTEKCARQVKDAFLDLKKKGITSLILDLRSNPGGLLNEAVDIVNLFVPRGLEVVATKGKMKQSDRIYKTSREPVDTEIPLAVLVNGESASASEIVSGALQDFDRAVIVGTRTYGKGLVQTVRDLPYGGNLKLTTAKYYIPSGRCIQKIDYSHRRADGSLGFTPDSLTKVFHTTAGREVRDAGGVGPDLVIKADTLPNILFYLVNESVIIDYATRYCLKHSSIAPVEQFVVTDADYNEFKDFVKQADFKYDRQSEKVLKSLKEIAEFEGYAEDAAEEFKALEKKFNHNLDRDLDHFSKDIRELIALEIVKRYYYQKGGIIEQIKFDDNLKKTIELLNTPAEYKKILSAPAKA